MTFLSFLKRLPTDKSTDRFGTIFQSIDGRPADCVKKWAQETYAITTLRQFTEPGMPGILVGKQMFEEQPKGLLSWLRYKAEKVSVEQHGNKVSLIVGHAYCVGHRDDEKTHIADIRRAVDIVYEWGCFDEVCGLYVTFARNIGEGWKPERIFGRSRQGRVLRAG